MKLLFQSILSSCLFFGGSLIHASLVGSAIAQDTLQGQVTSVNQPADVQPTDWAFAALQALVDRYDCMVGYPHGCVAKNFRNATHGVELHVL